MFTSIGLNIDGAKHIARLSNVIPSECVATSSRNGRNQDKIEEFFSSSLEIFSRTTRGTYMCVCQESRVSRDEQVCVYVLYMIVVCVKDERERERESTQKEKMP